MVSLRHVLLLVGLGILVVLGACSPPEPEDPDLPPKPKGWKLGAVTEEGRMTYKMVCQTCHGESGDGKGPSSVPLTTKPRNFTDRDYMKTRSDWRIYVTIRDGGGEVGLSSTMPSWKDALPEEQILQVAAFVRQFAK